MLQSLFLWRWLSLLLLSTYAPQQAWGLKGDSNCSGTSFCVNATLENDIVTYQFTTLQNDPESVGWMALGFGDQMLGTHMVVLWRNDDGSLSISQRYAAWYSEPIVPKTPPRKATAIEPKLTAWHTSGTTTFAFQIPANKTHLASKKPREKLIWALSPIRPLGDNPHTRLVRHTEIGYLHLDLTKDLPGTDGVSTPDTHAPISVSISVSTTAPTETETTVLTSTSAAVSASSAPSSTPVSQPNGVELEDSGEQLRKTHSKTVLAHGIFLSLGFLLFLPLGVLTGRWGRTISPIWFKIHWICNAFVAGPVIVLGWLLGIIAVNQTDAPHFDDKHKVFGSLLVVVYVAQNIFGYYIHKKKAALKPPITRHHPPLNILHVIVGLVILASAFFQVRTGLDKLSHHVSDSLADLSTIGHKLWSAWVVVLPFLYVVGLCLLPRQFALEQSGAQAGSSGYVALSEDTQSPSTRLLFENPDADGDEEDGRRQGPPTRERY